MNIKNINFTPAIRKTVLGGVAALAVAGGALTMCNKPAKCDEAIKLEQLMDSIATNNKLSIEQKEIMEKIQKN